MEKTAAQKNAQRGKVLRFLRKTHGWLGLWGAVLGLLFGLSGFLLNHRAVMKIPAAKMEETEIQLPVNTALENKDAFTKYIQQALNIHHDPMKRPPRKGDKPERDVAFLGKEMKQPQVWKVEFQMPHAAIKAEYVAGNQYATVTREDANVYAFITRMHKGVGANPAWVLLADSIAGALILLSITGVLLWTKMRGSRLALASLMGGSIILTVWFTLQMM